MRKCLKMIANDSARTLQPWPSLLIDCLQRNRIRRPRYREYYGISALIGTTVETRLPVDGSHLNHALDDHRVGVTEEETHGDIPDGEETNSQSLDQS